MKPTTSKNVKKTARYRRGARGPGDEGSHLDDSARSRASTESNDQHSPSILTTKANLARRTREARSTKDRESTSKQRLNDVRLPTKKSRNGATQLQRKQDSAHLMELPGAALSAGPAQEVDISLSATSTTELTRETDINSARISEPGSHAVYNSLSAAPRDDNGMPSYASDSEREPQTSPEPIIARLVDEESERLRRESERTRIRNETMAEIRANVPEAEIIDDRAVRYKRRRLFLLLAIVTLASVIIAVVFGISPRSERALSREEILEQILREVYGDLEYENWRQASGSQDQAFDWMALNDTLIELPIQSTDEEAVLVQRWVMCVLAFATDLPSWGNQERWLEESESECEWSGVTCNSQGRIIGLNLAMNSLNGTLPTDIGLLQDLRYLFVHGNPFLRGRIPSEIGNITSLVSLYANDNALTGSLPSELGNLANFEKLNVARNGLTGSIPKRFAFMHELVDLDLGDNNIIGSLPSAFWRLQRLETLRLGNNMLEGLIPSDIGQMAELRHLELQNNRLTGMLPTQFGGLVNLRSLVVFGNELGGTVPAEVCSLDGRNVLEVLEMDCLAKVICGCCSSCT